LCGEKTEVNKCVCCVIAGFCRKVDENCAVLDYYIANNGHFFYQCSVQPGFFTPKDGTNRLSRNVGKQLPLLAV
jgi:hypothetical protein